MQFHVGLDEVDQHVLTKLLTVQPFPTIKIAYFVISTKEPHTQTIGFVSKTNQMS